MITGRNAHKRRGNVRIGTDWYQTTHGHAWLRCRWLGSSDDGVCHHGRAAPAL